MSSTNTRVGTVDGFRAIAILAVLLYHYYYRYAPPMSARNYYPFQIDASAMKYGFYGVQLFFVISGFVIFHTLGKCSGRIEFFKKRLIRLLPSAVICSILTYIVVLYLDPGKYFPSFHTTTLWSFVPGLTFTPPAFWNNLLNRTDITYLDGVYWSLYTEVIFYLIACFVYFHRPRAFLSNWVLICFVTVALRILTAPAIRNHFPAAMDSVLDGVHHLLFVLNTNYFVYFALGTFFYCVYVRQKPTRLTMALMTVITLLELYLLGDPVLRALLLLIIGLFVVLVYRERWLVFFNTGLITRLGLISYPLYLLHQNIGLVLIHRAFAFSQDPSTAIYLPIAVAAVMIVLSEIIYRYFESPLSTLLKKHFISSH